VAAATSELGASVASTLRVGGLSSFRLRSGSDFCSALAIHESDRVSPIFIFISVILRKNKK
jgi:hypothetical protein